MGKFLSVEQARARYVPAEAQRVDHVQACAVSFVYERGGRPCYALFKARAGKPFKHHQFGDATKRDEHLSAAVAALTEAAVRRMAERKARAAYRHPLKVGSILYTSWGYDQTNVEFFEVVALPSRSAVELVELQQERTATGDMQGKAVPLPGQRKEGATVLRRLVRPGYENRAMVRLESFRIAGEWDGQPKAWTSYA